MTNTFDERIKELRLEKGLTQGELAKAIDVSKSTVAMWETGKRLPSTEIYELLADLFNVDIDYLYCRTNIKKKHHFAKTGEEYISANYLAESGVYTIAQEIFEDDDMKLLFDLKKSAQADRLMSYAKFLKEVSKKENGL